MFYFKSGSACTFIPVIKSIEPKPICPLKTWHRYKNCMPQNTKKLKAVIATSESYYLNGTIIKTITTMENKVAITLIMLGCYG